MGAHFMFKSLKSPTTYTQQVSILESRNITIQNKTQCEIFLSHVNYYRLSGYLLPFINKPDEKCKQAISIEKIEAIYRFDSEIRNLLLSAIERIEIYLGTQLSYYSAHHYGADGYMDPNNYNAKHDHIKFEGLINSTIQDNRKAPAVRHHIAQYGGKFPIWVIIEFFTIGMISHFYTDMKNHDKATIAFFLYSVNYQTLSSWLRCLTDLRNRCAHYSRLYYWKFSAIPRIRTGDAFKADRSLFTQIYMLKYLYPDDWNDDLLTPLIDLFEKYSSYITLSHIGFPKEWKTILKK